LGCILRRTDDIHISQSIDQIHFIPQKTLIHTIHTIHYIYTAKTHEHPTYKNHPSPSPLQKKPQTRPLTKKKKAHLQPPHSPRPLLSRQSDSNHPTLLVPFFLLLLLLLQLLPLSRQPDSNSPTRPSRLSPFFVVVVVLLPLLQLLLPLLLPGPRTSAIEVPVKPSPPGTGYGAKDWAVDFWKCDHRVLLTGVVKVWRSVWSTVVDALMVVVVEGGGRETGGWMGVRRISWRVRMGSDCAEWKKSNTSSSSAAAVVVQVSSDVDSS